MLTRTSQVTGRRSAASLRNPAQFALPRDGSGRVKGAPAEPARGLRAALTAGWSTIPVAVPVVPVATVLGHPVDHLVAPLRGVAVCALTGPRGLHAHVAHGLGARPHTRAHHHPTTPHVAGHPLRHVVAPAGPGSAPRGGCVTVEPLVAGLARRATCCVAVGGELLSLRPMAKAAIPTVSTATTATTAAMGIHRRSGRRGCLRPGWGWLRWSRSSVGSRQCGAAERSEAVAVLQQQDQHHRQADTDHPRRQPAPVSEQVAPGERHARHSSAHLDPRVERQGVHDPEAAVAFALVGHDPLPPVASVVCRSSSRRWYSSASISPRA
jgi:hypothetical protein